MTDSEHGAPASEAESNLIVVEQPDAARLHIVSKRREEQSIGVVPTMGALHEGHLSLIRAARAECDFVAVTIFVNPMQFGPQEDLERYPRPLEADLTNCRSAGVDLVFVPSRESIYPSGFATSVEVEGLSSKWEGQYRPTHFRGVTTVVLKLLNILQPDIAYFGQKDFQQQVIIRHMCRDLNVPVEIRTCPTVRADDGLAVSSRNAYLSVEERQSARAISQSLQLAKRRLLNGESDVSAIRAAMQELLESTPLVRLDYATVADPESLEELSSPQSEMVALVAANVGTTRLIDNMPITLNDT